MSHRRRLDHILLEKGLITEAQIKEALKRQAILGGKFGTHLLYGRFVTPQQLCAALSEQFGVPPAPLPLPALQPALQKLVPFRIAKIRQVYPFHYDAENQTIFLAMTDPDDDLALQDVHRSAGEKKIKRHVVPEALLAAAIERNYKQPHSSLDPSTSLRVLDEQKNCLEDISEAKESDGLVAKAEVIIIGNTSCGDLDHFLRGAGFTVVRATTITEVVTLAGRRFPVALVCCSAPPFKNETALIQLIQRSPEIHSLPVIICSDHATPEDTVNALRLGADDFVELRGGFELLALKLTHLSKKLAHFQIAADTITGSLNQLNLIDLIQLLTQSARTALIKLEKDHQNAAIYLNKGQLYSAHCGQYEGAEAIYYLLTWSTGKFSVVLVSTLPAQNIFVKTQAVLLEGCRLLDESQISPAVQIKETIPVRYLKD